MKKENNSVRNVVQNSENTLDVNKIHLGDCLELMQSIPKKSIDMILCDLPYG
jgi:DNA modification methylase